MPTPSREAQRDIVREIGARLKTARQAAGMSQLCAANKLGYSNSSKLSKIESGAHSSQIPVWVLIRAAELYETSVGFLLGIGHLDGRGCPSRVRDLMVELHEIDSRQINTLLHEVQTDRRELSVAVRLLSQVARRFELRHAGIPGLEGLSNAVTAVTFAMSEREKVVVRPVKRVFPQDVYRQTGAFA